MNGISLALQCKMNPSWIVCPIKEYGPHGPIYVIANGYGGGGQAIPTAMQYAPDWFQLVTLVAFVVMGFGLLLALVQWLWQGDLL